MSSDSESSEAPSFVESTDESEEEWIESEIAPYQDEPLADVSEDETARGDDEGQDLDGLTPAVLEARYDRTVSVESWLVALCEHVFFLKDDCFLTAI